MKIIAIEEHVLPADLRTAGGTAQWMPPGVDGPLDDVGDARLHAMDEAGIDIQVLSFLGHPVQQLRAADSIRFSRQANDALAGAVKSHPDRFSAFAQLPISSPKDAVVELRRAVGDLGFVGTMIHGQSNGLFLDDERFDELLGEVAELGVPLYLHPAEPPDAVRRAYFGSLPSPLDHVLMTTAWGWHAEVGLHVLRMIATGVFDRHPTLQVIVGHMGEDLPFSLARADTWLSPVMTTGKSVMETAVSNVHVTTCGYTTLPPFLCAFQVFGPDRILFSVDYPFSPPDEAVAFLHGLPISGPDQVKIAGLNAARLLRL